MRALVVTALLTSLAAARAETGERAAIVVVAKDAAFREALSVALVDHDVHDAGDMPPPALAQLADQSRRLADASAAVATVWLSEATEGATLVTYDRRADRFLVRELPYAPPLTPTQAAEAARMVRTMLRALRTADDDALVKALLPEPIEPPPPPPRPVFAASLGIGAWFAAPEASATPLTAITIAWRPHDLGVALGLAFAPAADIETMSFRGDVCDIVLAAELRKALVVAPLVRVTPAVGMTLHAITLDGAFQSGEQVESRRFDPAVRVAVTPSIALSRGLELGLGVSADLLLRRQRYEAGTEQILLVPRVQVMSSLWIGVRL